MKASKRRLLLPVVSVAAVVCVGAGAYTRSAFDRPGESALSLVPAEATGLLVMDFTPGVRQLGAFRQIAASAKSANVGKTFDETVTSLVNDDLWVQKLIPFTRRSLVIATMPGPEKIGGNARDSWYERNFLIVPVSDVSSVQTILAKHLHKKNGYYAIPNFGSDLALGMVQNNIVVGSSAKVIDLVRTCAWGTHASIVDQAEYRVARKQLDYDANLMGFVSTSVVGPHDQTPASPSKAWLAGGMAIRDEGISFSFNYPVDNNEWQAYKALSAMAPIRNDILTQLPAGAYAVTALSQPSAIWNSLKLAAKGNAESERTLREFATSAERELGLNFERELIPALGGTSVVAVYPSSEKPTKGLDILIYSDAANGADPSKLIEAVRRYTASHVVPKTKPEASFEPIDIGSDRGYHLASGVRADAEKQLAEELPEGTARKVFKGKTVAYAMVGDTLLISTSDALLKLAASTLHHSNDKAISVGAIESAPRIGKDAPQFVAVIDPVRAGNGISHTYDWHRSPDGSRSIEETAVAKLARFRAPLSVVLRAGPTAANGKIFIPIDYASVAEVFKDDAKQKPKKSLTVK